MTTVSIPVPDESAPVIKPALDRDPAKGGEWLRLGFEARLTELYKDWQAMRISTSRFAELLGINMWGTQRFAECPRFEADQPAWLSRPFLLETTGRLLQVCFFDYSRM